jgi:hypothetical protein
MQDTSFLVSPIPEHTFFEKTQFESLLSNNLFQIVGCTAQQLDLIRSRSTRSITGQPFLASLKELLRPGIVQALGNAFSSAEFSDTVLASQAIQYNPDLFF